MQPLPPHKVSPFWFLLLICALLPFFWALGFLHPRCDDFDYATRAMFFLDVPSALYEVGKEWIFWSGRYTHHFLVTLLGKGGVCPPLAALVCLAVMATYALAGWILARALGGTRRWSALCGLFFLFCLLTAHQGLPLFYMQTDALSVGLQGGMSLLFMALLCRLWRAQPTEAVPRSGVRHGAMRTQRGWRALWRRCAAPTVWAASPRRAATLAGVLAVGVYEYSALAVFLVALATALLAWRCRHPLARDLTRVGAWIFLALLLSFLAPGNFVRRAARDVDATVVLQHLATLPADWLHNAFWCLSLPWAVTVLAASLLLPRPAREERESLPSPYPWLCLIAPPLYVLFSFCIALLHAGTDASFASSPKFAAALAPYGALALGATLHPLLGRLARRLRHAAHARDMRLWLVLLPAVLLLCGGANWRLTSLNAANGAFADLDTRLSLRYALLEQTGRAATWDDPAFRFGLLGEAARPGSRRRAVDSALPALVVRRLDYGVFPIYAGEDLPLTPESWPNLWVAWLYGLGGVQSAPGNGAAAVAAALQSSARELALTPELEELGVRDARLAAIGGDNATFSEIWLVLRCAAPLPENWTIWNQSPVDIRRLLPFPLQRWWRMLEADLARKREALPDLLADVSGVRLNVRPEQWRVPDPGEGKELFYAFPLQQISPLAAAGSVPPLAIRAETPRGLMPLGR